jgi:hypothetical protein
MSADNYALARELAGWKSYITRVWDEIEIVKFDLKNLAKNVFRSGHNYTTEIILDIKDIPVENVGVELVVTRQMKNGEFTFFTSREFKYVSRKKGRVIYSVDFQPEMAGTFYYGIRIYAKNDALPHRQDFCLLRWVD